MNTHVSGAKPNLKDKSQVETLVTRIQDRDLVVNEE
jgi:hypothetical protein